MGFPFSLVSYRFGFPTITVKKKFVLQIVAICMFQIEAYFFGSVLLVEKSHKMPCKGIKNMFLVRIFAPLKGFTLYLIRCAGCGISNDAKLMKG